MMRRPIPGRRACLRSCSAPVRTRAFADYDAGKLGLDPPQMTVTADATRIVLGPIDHDRYAHRQ